MPEYPNKDSFSFPSTGNPQEDDRIADEYMRREKRLIEGVCANGCGPMERMDAYHMTCPRCRFIYGSNVVLK